MRIFVLISMLMLNLSLPGTAAASVSLDLHQKLRSLLSEVKTSCTDDICSNGFSLKKVYSVPSLNALEPALLAALHEKAFDLAQIWGDTILEGDYAADGKTQLEQVDVLRLHGEVVAYRLQYSEGGWDMAQGLAGRIRESAWTLPGFEADHSEDDQLVVFVPAQR